MQVEGAGDDQAKLVDVDRFAVEIVSAETDRLERAFPSPVSRGDDDLRVRLEPKDLFKRGETFGRAVGIGRKAKVERDNCGLMDEASAETVPA